MYPTGNWSEKGEEWANLVLRSDSQHHNWLECRFLQPLSVDISPKLLTGWNIWLYCLVFLVQKEFSVKKNETSLDSTTIKTTWLAMPPEILWFGSIVWGTMYQRWVAISDKIGKDWSLKRSVRWELSDKWLLLPWLQPWTWPAAPTNASLLPAPAPTGRSQYPYKSTIYCPPMHFVLPCHVLSWSHRSWVLHKVMQYNLALKLIPSFMNVVCLSTIHSCQILFCISYRLAHAHTQKSK